MRLTARQLNRATLGRQLLLGRERIDVLSAVRRIVALQAQEPASPYIALWSRVIDLDPAELDRAFADATIVKATLMRITLHAVDAADYPAFHQAMQPSLRASCLGDPRFTRAGLSIADAEALIPLLLEFGAKPRSNADIEGWLDDRLGELPKSSVWWALRRFAPFVHSSTSPPWSFGPRPSYVAAPTQPRWSDEAKAVQHLVERYLEGFGPASLRDIAQFSTKYVSPIRDALAALDHKLVRLEGPAGVELFDIAGGLLPPEDAPAPPRFMAMWDSTLLAYADRTRIIPPEVRALVIRNNGDVLPTMLVDGYVAGVWRPVDGGIEATSFGRLSDAAWEGLEAEARLLIAFLADREPIVYRRYSHWWSGLPAADVRVLGGA
ncbi:MAG TPA: winged helix DNA-binding domain-containing protein [Candidatus Limnocylindrales bacterium]|nr:winged helix DNA-binding domain-containing protein [Candidatus Limnocylindrales bacterium]